MVKSKGQKVFHVFNIIFMIALSFCFLAPYWMILAASLTEGTALSLNGYSLWPQRWSFDSYKFILKTNPMILTAMKNSILFTVEGTLVTVLVTMLYAYPLSRKSLHFKKFWNIFLVIPMLIGGGLIPTFLIVTAIFNNTYLAIIIPSALTPWYAILMRNYFAALPDSFEEAAKIDGAGSIRILFLIYLPLSKPIIATVALYTAVAYWNNWVGPMLYIEEKSKYPIQYLMQQIMMNVTNIFGNGAEDMPSMEGIKMACTVLASLPIIIVYPFLQKYFINGTIVGGVKE